MPLRSAVLSALTDMLLATLTGQNLTSQQQDDRDMCLSILEEHLCDLSIFIRAKVFQHWIRLQNACAVPRKWHHVIINHCVAHLTDKGPLVRKYAVECVTLFLKTNVYGGQVRKLLKLE